MDVEGKVAEIEGKINEHSLAYEILQELKQSNKKLWAALFVVLALWFITIGGFVWYINQYDYSTTIDATGVYTAVDHSGNIITQDVTPEQWELFMEWLNGENKDN